MTTKGENISCLYSADNNTLLYGTEDGSIICVNLGREAESKIILGNHVHPIQYLQWKGTSLVSVCSQNHLRVLNTYTNKVVLSHSLSANSILSGSYVFSIINNIRLNIISLDTGNLLDSIFSVTLAHFVNLVQFGNLIITGHKDGSIQVWNLNFLS